MAKNDDAVRNLLLRSFDEAYERRAWHGTNLRGALRGLSAEEAVWRPAAGRHNIWELVTHITYWKYAVWRRLTGVKRGSFTRKGSNWFESPDATEKAWREEIAHLASHHQRLREVIEKMPAKDFAAKSHPRYDNAALIAGVTAHDLYHTGQIQILKRLQY